MKMNLSAKIMHKNSCLNKSFSDIYDEHLLEKVSGDFPDSTAHYSSKVISGGVRLKYETVFDSVQGVTPIKHVFFFPTIEETREKAHILSTGQPKGTSMIDISLAEVNRSYVNATVYTKDYELIRSDVLVFDSEGNVFPYPEKADMYSSLNIGEVDVRQETNDSGEDIIKIYINILKLDEKDQINVAFQTSGIYIQSSQDIMDEGLYTSEILLSDERITQGNWLLAISDSKGKMILQALIHIGG
jgi:hypothetical protein